MSENLFNNDDHQARNKLDKERNFNPHTHLMSLKCPKRLFYAMKECHNNEIPIVTLACFVTKFKDKLSISDLVYSI